MRTSDRGEHIQNLINRQARRLARRDYRRALKMLLWPGWEQLTGSVTEQVVKRKKLEARDTAVRIIVTHPPVAGTKAPVWR